MTTSEYISGKTKSMFYPSELVGRLRGNISRHGWAKTVAEKTTEDAQPWAEMPDDQLWSLMFGATIPRSWMV